MFVQPGLYLDLSRTVCAFVFYGDPLRNMHRTSIRLLRPYLFTVTYLLAHV